ncbi:DUF5615 family PIN-like protein [Nostoc sp. XA013]|nr:DUF5615 family PIN-like protein [Nostoc sp. XA013]
MVLLYADEGFPKVVTGLLRQFGHDVLTVQEAGQANQQIPDDQVLALGTIQGRAVLTVRDFQIKKYPIAFRAGEQGAGSRGRKSRCDSKNWIIYFLEFPKSR